MSGEEKKRMKSVVCAGIVTLLLAGCAKANLVNSNSIIEDNIEYYMQTDNAVYNLGEEVQMLYRVTNRGDEEVYFEFPTNKQYHFRVSLIDGTHIWQMDTDAADVVTYFTLQPDESKEFNEIWGQVNDNGTRGGTDDYPVELGNYQVIGEFYIPITDHYVPVSVSIQIIPEPASLLLLGMGLLGLLFHSRKER